jgi:hypothetical protein
MDAGGDFLDLTLQQLDGHRTANRSLASHAWLTTPCMRED